MMGMLQDFKEFVMKGNVVDLAVGVVIGAAFGKIVGTLVDKVIMPILGWMTAGTDFSQLTLNIGETIGPDGVIVPAIAIGYGALVQSLIDFIIVALVIFLIIKSVQAMRKKEAALVVAPVEPSIQEKLLMEIRDALKAR